MKRISLKSVVRLFTAMVWLVNGFFCKVLNLVPRHQEIVAAILHTDHSRIFTILIGIGEIFMAVWIISGISKKLNAITQILIIAVMNILEFLLVPDLLLWGKANILFAFLFILLIYFNSFFMKDQLQNK